MALLYRAQLVPSKIEMLSAWVPGQPWCGGVDASDLAPLGAYRFDDPAGEVGIETHLLGTPDGYVMQVPTTYRAGPLDGAEAALIGTTEHSVLGRRWVYDACADPVWAAALAEVVRTGGHEAVLEVEAEGKRQTRPPTARVTGVPGVTGIAAAGSTGMDVAPAVPVPHRHDGATTITRIDGLDIVLRRLPTPDLDAGASGALTGVWPGQDRPVVLALVTGT